MKETGLTGKRRSTTIAATPDDGNSQRKRRSEPLIGGRLSPQLHGWSTRTTERRSLWTYVGGR